MRNTSSKIPESCGLLKNIGINNMCYSLLWFPADHSKDYKKAFSNPRAQEMKKLLKWKQEYGLHWSIFFLAP